MGTISKELKNQTQSKDSSVHEKAARQLGLQANGESIDLLVDMLADEDSIVVHYAARSIADIGSNDAIERMIVLLGSDSARLRNLAIEILSRIGSPALPRVTELLGDFDPDIRKFAIDILKSMATPDTRDALIRTLYDDNVNVAADAAEVLGDLGLESAVPFLIECMEKEPWLKSAGIRSLGRIGGKTALNAVLSVPKDEETIILFCVITALGDMADPLGLDYLLEIFKNSNPALAFTVAQAVERILPNADPKDIQNAKNVMETKLLTAMLQSRNTSHVLSAVRLLGFFGIKSAVPAILKLYTESNRLLFADIEEAILKIRPDRMEPIIQIIEDPKEPDSVKISVVRLIGQMKNEKSFDALVFCLKQSREELAVEIIHTMTDIKDKRAVEIFHNYLFDPLPEIRMAAVKGLEKFRSSKSLYHLFKMAEDESEDVRLAAAKSLCKYDHTRLKEMIIKLLNTNQVESILFGLEMIKEDHVIEFEKDIYRLCNHENRKIKKAAAKKAGSLKTKMAFESIIPLISDKNAKVRLAGIRALENFPDLDIGRVLVDAAGADPDVWNRYEAIKMIGKMGFSLLQPQLKNLRDNAPELIRDAIDEIVKELNSEY